MGRSMQIHPYRELPVGARQQAICGSTSRSGLPESAVGQDGFARYSEGVLNTVRPYTKI